MIMALLPPDVFCGGSVSNVYVGSSRNPRKSRARTLWFLGFANSLVLDYLLRKEITKELAHHHVLQAPCPLPGSTYREDKHMLALAQCAGNLVCTAPEFRGVAEAVGIPVRREIANGTNARSETKAMIDALMAQRFGLTEREFVHVIWSFSSLNYAIKVSTQNAFRSIDRART